MCPHEEKVTAWLLGDLPPRERQAMTSHLASCEACRAVRDELGGVLSALRSGLAKDGGRAPDAARRAQDVRRREWWAGWLRHAALLAVSFGTLFSVLAAVYLLTGRARAPRDEVVTHMTFHPAGALAVPPLAPLPEPPAAEPPLIDMGDFTADAHAATGWNMTVDTPVPPVGIPLSPRLFGLVDPADVAATERIIAMKARPGAAPPLKLTDITKTRKQGAPFRDDARADPEPSGDARVGPVTLAAAPPDGGATNTPASTNNAALTNNVTR
jgi:hypothetical protein